MNKTYSFNIIQKHIYFNMLDLMQDGVESKLTAYDILPVVVAPCLYLDFKSALSKNKKLLITEIERRKARGKLNYYQYDFNSLVDKLNATWIEDLDERIAQKYMTDFWLIDGFDADGYAIINPNYYEIYSKMKSQQLQPEEIIRYGSQSKSSSRAKKINTDESDANIFGHHVYLWKLKTEDCIKQLENTEIACVNNPQKVPFDISTFTSMGDYMNACKFTKCRRGCVEYAYWEFANIVNGGDFIILYDTQVRDVVRGVGIVGKYRYNPNLSSYQSRRDVNWIMKETVQTPHNFREPGIWARIIYNEDVLEKCKPLIQLAINR